MVNTTLEMRDTGLLLHLSNGSPCREPEDSHGSSTIMFLCDATVYGSGILQYLQLKDTDRFFMQASQW